MELMRKNDYTMVDPITTHIVMICVAVALGGLVALAINFMVFGQLFGEMNFITFAIYATCITLSLKFVYLDNIVRTENTLELGWYGIMMFLGKPIEGIVLYGSGNYALPPFKIIRLAFVDMRPMSRLVLAEGTTIDATPVKGPVTVQYKPMDVFQVFYVSETLIHEGFNGIIGEAVDLEVGDHNYLDLVASKSEVHKNILEDIFYRIRDKPGTGNDLKDYNVHVMSVTVGDFRASPEDEKQLRGITEENVEQKAQGVEQNHYNAMIEQEYNMIMRLDPKMDKSIALMKAIDQINIRTGKMLQPSMQRIVFEGNQVDSLAGLGALMNKK